MEAENAIIPVRDKAQAMDWSLVLISQGIEATIEHLEETDAWQLGLPAAELGRARETLRLYLWETRQKVWQQELPWLGLFFDWRSLIWVASIAALFAAVQASNWPLVEAGCMDRAAVLNGQWWRLFTAVTLHENLPHLANNATSGFILLGFAMGGYGTGIALLATLLAGAGGNLAGLLFHSSPYRGLGASGQVMGALGLLTVMSLAARYATGARQWLSRGFMSGVLLLILLGTNPQSDVVAHVGGFFSGCVAGLALNQLPQKWLRSAMTDGIASLLCGLLVVLTWLLALRHPGAL